jgi:hypothetical protein
LRNELQARANQVIESIHSPSNSCFLWLSIPIQLCYCISVIKQTPFKLQEV